MSLLNVLTELGEGISSLFVSIAQKIVTIFFSVTEGGALQVTPIGYIALIGLVLSVVYFVFRWVASLVRGRSSR